VSVCVRERRERKYESKRERKGEKGTEEANILLSCSGC